METLVRSTTLRHISRRLDGYEHLESSIKKASEKGRGWRNFSTRRTPTALGRVKTPAANYNHMTMSPVCYKRDRARRRHLFLQGYKLSMNTTTSKARPLRSGIKLKKAVVKVRSMVVSVLSFMRAAALKPPCTSKSAIQCY